MYWPCIQQVLLYAAALEEGLVHEAGHAAEAEVEWSDRERVQAAQGTVDKRLQTVMMREGAAVTGGAVAARTVNSCMPGPRCAML